MADDALTALLGRLKLTDDQRAGLWDLYRASKNTGDLTDRLKSLDLSDEIKADLWDLKASERAPTPKAETKTEPSAGYWEDRGIAGKVWHPASGVKEGDRGDVNILGVPPELAAVSALSLGRAVLKPSLDAAGRVAAGAANAAGQAMPIIKYEVAQKALEAAGIPEPFRSAAAGVFAVRGGKKGTPAEAATVERDALAIPKTVTPSIERTKQAAADWRAAQGIPPQGRPSAGSPAARAGAAVIEPPAVAKSTQVPPRAAPAAEKAVVEKAQKLKSHEVLMGMKLRKAGLGEDKIKEVIDELRKLPLSWQKLPTDAEVAAIVKQSNEGGRMVR